MSLSKLQQWYANQCNGEWEHTSGVRIDTLDNPGWTVRINLQGTKKETASLERVILNRSHTDWIQYWVAERDFRIACGPLNLVEGIDIFLQWFDS